MPATSIYVILNKRQSSSLLMSVSFRIVGVISKYTDETRVNRQKRLDVFGRSTTFTKARRESGASLTE